MGTCTNPLSTPPNLQHDIEQEFVASNVDAPGSRYFQCKDMGCNESTDAETNGVRVENLFGASSISVQIRRHGKQKFAKELLQVLSWSKLAS